MTVEDAAVRESGERLAASLVHLAAELMRDGRPCVLTVDLLDSDLETARVRVRLEMAAR